jgi:hypothetical protein
MITNASGSGAFMMNYVLFEKCGKHWKAMEKKQGLHESSLCPG